MSKYVEVLVAHRDFYEGQVFRIYRGQIFKVIEENDKGYLVNCVVSSPVHEPKYCRLLFPKSYFKELTPSGKVFCKFTHRELEILKWSVDREAVYVDDGDGKIVCYVIGKTVELELMSGFELRSGFDSGNSLQKLWGSELFHLGGRNDC